MTEEHENDRDCINYSYLEESDINYGSFITPFSHVSPYHEKRRRMDRSWTESLYPVDLCKRWRAPSGGPVEGPAPQVETQP